MSELYEKFFTKKPFPSSHMEGGHQIYHNESLEPVKWSGKFPLPDIGSRVYVTMNGIGWAVVKGYFESAGYVGLMTLPTKPPAYLLRQWKETRKAASRGKKIPQWVLDGIGCEFGSEVALKNPKVERARVQRKAAKDTGA